MGVIANDPSPTNPQASHGILLFGYPVLSTGGTSRVCGVNGSNRSSPLKQKPDCIVWRHNTEKQKMQREPKDIQTPE